VSGIALFVLIAVVALAIAGLSAYWNHKRGQALAAFAAAHGWSYIDEAPGFESRWDGDPFGNGQDKNDLFGSMIITPSIDKEFAPGGASSISDVKDNVHWFEALTDSAFVFNIHVNGLKSNPKSPGRIYVDPNGEKIEGGKIRARVLDHDECTKLYG